MRSFAAMDDLEGGASKLVLFFFLLSSPCHSKHFGLSLNTAFPSLLNALEPSNMEGAHVRLSRDFCKCSVRYYSDLELRLMELLSLKF